MEKDVNSNVYQDVPAEGREGILKDVCYSFEERKIQVPYSEEQLNELKEKLSEKSVELSQIVGEKKKQVAEFDTKIKPLQLEVTDSVKKLRAKCDEVDTMVYNIANYNSGMMESFDKNGIFISARKLFADEKQVTVKVLNERTGTDD